MLLICAPLQTGLTIMAEPRDKAYIPWHETEAVVPVSLLSLCGPPNFASRFFKTYCAFPCLPLSLNYFPACKYPFSDLSTIFRSTSLDWQQQEGQAHHCHGPTHASRASSKSTPPIRSLPGGDVAQPTSPAPKHHCK